MNLILTIDGVDAAASPRRREPLVRAVVISLFTWRRANDDDQLPGDSRMGWWGDSYEQTTGDKIGSRIWLLSRSTITDQTATDLVAYARECLQWLLDDNVASSIDVSAVRRGLDRIDMVISITQATGEPVVLRFDNVWSYIRAI